MPISATWEQIEKAIQDFVVAGTGLADTNVIWSDGKPRPSGTYVAMTLLTDDSPANNEVTQAHNPLVLADDVVEVVNPVTDRLTLTAHAYVNVDGAVRLTTTGVLPALATGTLVNRDVWLIVVDANTVKLAGSRADAITGTALDITDVGTGVHTIVDTADTRRKGAEIIHRARGQVRCEVQMQCFATPPAGANTARALLRKLIMSADLPAQRARLNERGIGMIGFERVQVTPAIANLVVFEPRAVTVFAFNVADEATETGTNIVTAEVTRTITGQPPKTNTLIVETP